ncbi:MAG: hypothetical protein LKJ88_04285 [Bacilli bacterium]|jgi:signal transduction histidine kinase|nr:hypothetical protein [Bacilli bacterium]
MNAIFNDSMEVKAVIIILLLMITLLLSVGLLMEILLKPNKIKMAYAIMAIWGGGLLELGWLIAFYNNSNVLLTTMLLYCPALVLAYAPFYGFKEKKPIVIADMLALFLILPFMQFNKYTIIYYFLALVFYFFRSSFYLFSMLSLIVEKVNLYSLKISLDNLDGGLIITDKRQAPAFINQTFINYLAKKDIPQHQKKDQLMKQLTSGAEKVADYSWLIKDENNYFLLKEKEGEGGSELLLLNVSSEMALENELKKVNEDLTKEQNTLIEALDDLKKIERIKERDRVRSLVHDSFAEEVSFIHQIITNPKTNDLRPLKELVKKEPFKEDSKTKDVKELIEEYQLLNVNIILKGSLNKLPHQDVALAIIKEGIDNAIRHGNAVNVNIAIQKGTDTYNVEIKNDGKIPTEFSMHNGLTNLKASVESIGGELVIEKNPAFTLIAKIPLLSD